MIFSVELSEGLDLMSSCSGNPVLFEEVEEVAAADNDSEKSAIR